MNLLHPIALLWASLAVPIVVFYILKIRMRRVPVSTIMFWREIFEETQPRSIWQKLRHLLSLLIQLAFLALIVFALAEPIFRWEIREARRIVLVIDNSASMNAVDVAPNRLAKAKEAAREIIEGLRSRDELAILSAGTLPQVQCGLTGHQKTLRDRLEAIPPGDGPTRVKETVELARRLLSDQPNRKIIVFSDGGFEGVDTLTKAEDVRLVAIGGEKTGNVGITQFQTRRSLLDPVGYQILAEVRNDSDEAIETRLELELDGRPVDVVPIKLEANGVWSQVFEKASPEGGTLVAKLNRADLFPLDNEARAILPRREVQSVTLLTEGNLFLQMVFRANPLVDLTIAKTFDAKAPRTAVTVFHKTVPAKLPPGNLLVIEPAGSCDLWTVGETLQNPIVTKQDKDSPLLAHVRLDNILMPEARKIVFAKGVQAKPLVTALSGDPLFSWIDRPEGKVLVLTVDLDKGDLPLQTAFPIMVANALGWFAGTKGDLRESLATGSVSEVELPRSLASLTSIVLRSPDGKEKILPVSGGKTTVGPLDRKGIWSLTKPVAAGSPQPETKSAEPPKPDLEVAVNLSNARESDLRVPVGSASAESTSLGGGFSGWPLWLVLSAMAWGLISLEWYLYQRRWIS